jgi:hypothetical protein
VLKQASEVVGVVARANYLAGLTTLLASKASALSNLPVPYRVTKSAGMTRSLAMKTFVVTLAGAVVLMVQYILNRQQFNG